MHGKKPAAASTDSSVVLAIILLTTFSSQAVPCPRTHNKKLASLVALIALRLAQPKER